MKQILVLFAFFFLFACSEEKKALPTINVLTHQAISWDEKLPCTIEYGEGGTVEPLPGIIKFRGGISRRYYKHSFSLELDKKYALCGLPKDDDWILNASYIDKTLMRHKISYGIFRQMSTRNIASQCAYLHLSVDSVYEGIYINMQEVNGAMVGLNKQDTMAMLFKDPPIFNREIQTSVQDSTNYYQQKFPKLPHRDKSYYLNGLREFMFHSSDEEFAESVGEWFDVDNVMDWHIMLLFSNNDDGLMKNFYLYKLDENTPLRFAIWDYDHSFGRDGDNELNMMERPVDIHRAILLTRLLAIPQTGYISKLRKRWFDLRDQQVISIENFEKHVVQNDKIIGAEMARNVERWPLDNDWYYDANTYSQELDVMRDFVKLRIPQLDRYFHELKSE